MGERMGFEARLAELAALVGDPSTISEFGSLYVSLQRELEAMREAGLDRQEARRLGVRLQDLLLAEAPVLEARRRLFAERRAAAEAGRFN